MGVEEFGVAVGGEGDGTGEFNGTPNYKAYLSRDFFIFKSPYLMLQLSIITRCKNISIILITNTVQIRRSHFSFRPLGTIILKHNTISNNLITPVNIRKTPNNIF